MRSILDRAMQGAKKTQPSRSTRTAKTPPEDVAEDQRGDAWEPPKPSKNGKHRQHDGESPKPQPWELPIPLDETPAVLPFPVTVFPESLQRFALETARVIGCPIDFVGASMLATASGAVGAARTLEVKAAWMQRTLLYLAIVGPPGDGKTPTIDLVAKPIYAAQFRLKQEFDDAMERYEQEHAEYQRALKERKKNPDAEMPGTSWIAYLERFSTPS